MSFFYHEKTLRPFARFLTCEQAGSFYFIRIINNFREVAVIKVQYPIGSKWIFADWPQTAEEARELATLARLYQSIERRGVKTGLYIIAEIPFEGTTLMLSSLERKEAITPDDTRLIQEQVLEKLRKGE